MDDGRREGGGLTGVSRRGFLAAGAGGVAMGAMGVAGSGGAMGAAVGEKGFTQRGYYITFMRLPTLGLAAWKQAVDCFAKDEINLLVLWMAGGFRSRKFPVTWKYNEEHENVRADFAGELIRYAQGKGIRVLLGFTPFGYDGVNQYSLERPELRAVKKGGGETDKFGIHCWGWNLCPSKGESQRFMLEYAREMLVDFYPQADGVLMESSDYAICHCAECAGKFYEREFELVKGISQAVWERKREAMIVVYPHYFSGSKVPGMEAEAAKQAFDPRWTLFFTPHSAHVERALVARARASLWSDDAPALHGPEAIQGRARGAKEAGISGYVPSLEGFSYVTTHVEEGREDLVGKRQTPFGFGWLKPGEMPFDELPVRVNRIAYRAFSNDPALSLEAWKARLGRELFGAEAEGAWVEDALLVQRLFFRGRTWSQPAPLASPERVRIDAARGRVKASALAEHRETLGRVREMVRRHAGSPNPGRGEMHRIGAWVLEQWAGAEGELLKG